MRFLAKIGTFILDCLFPLECRICGAAHDTETNPDGFLCNQCFSAIPLHQWLFCPVCGRKCIGYQSCARHRVSLTFLGVASQYQHPALKRLLWDYKYRFVEPLARQIAKLLNAYYDAVVAGYIQNNKEEWICAAIPLSPRRMRWRGFNQAALLAQEFSRHTGIPYVPCLRRAAFAIPQMKLGTREERFTAIKGAFDATPNAAHLLAGKRVILIDDIATSGATLLEASRALKRAAARQTIGLVVARNNAI